MQRWVKTFTSLSYYPTEAQICLRVIITPLYGLLTRQSNPHILFYSVSKYLRNSSTPWLLSSISIFTLPENIPKTSTRTRIVKLKCICCTKILWRYNVTQAIASSGLVEFIAQALKTTKPLKLLIELGYWQGKACRTPDLCVPVKNIRYCIYLRNWDYKHPTQFFEII